jgi:hypothetical protein
LAAGTVEQTISMIIVTSIERDPSIKCHVVIVLSFQIVSCIDPGAESVYLTVFQPAVRL